MTNSVCFAQQAAANGAWDPPVSLGGVGFKVAGGQNGDGRLEVFWTDQQDNIMHNWQTAPGGKWAGAANFGGQAKQLAAITDAQSRLTLIYIGMNNLIYINWSTPTGWQSTSLGNVQATQLSVNKNADGRLEMVFIGTDNCIYDTYQHAGNLDWNVPNKWQSTAKQITLAKNGDGRLELFFVGFDKDQIYHAWQTKPGQEPWQKSQLSGAARTIVAATNGEGLISLFYIGLDQNIYHNTQLPNGGGWGGDIRAFQGDIFQGGAWALALGCNADGRLQLFYQGNDGYSYWTWQSAVNGPYVGGDRHSEASAFSTLTDRDGRMSLFYIGTPEAPPPPIALTSQLVSGGLAALGGYIKVTINANGSVVWQGHAHDSGLDGYQYGVSALVTSPSGASVAVAHSGSIGGTATSGSRNDDWNVTYSNMAPGMYSAFSGAKLYSNLQYTSDMSTFATGAVEWALKFLAGATPVGTIAGLVIFVAAEIYSVIKTKSLVAGAIIAEDVLWMAGPLNTLVALGAAEIVKLGSNSRQLTQAEYDWANGPNLYAGALPSIDKLLITDTINGTRPFTFPRWDGKITLNLGPAGYKDPYNVPGYVKNEAFAHELLHSCQIANAPSMFDLMACVLSAKICGDASAYSYPNAGPDYVHFGIEQQAQIVGDWASGHQKSGNQTGIAEDVKSPYYPYIINNVRTRHLWAAL